MTLLFLLGTPNVIDAQPPMSSQQAGRPECQGRFRDPVIVRLISSLERMADVPPVWGSYTLANYPLVLVDSFPRGRSTPRCMAVWRHGLGLKTFEVDSAPELATPLYGMIDLDSVGSRAVPVFARSAVFMRRIPIAARLALEAIGVRRAVVLQVPLTYELLGKLGLFLQSQDVELVGLQAYLAVHEGFHLQSQFPKWLDQVHDSPWPDWDVQPDRAALARYCYADSSSLEHPLLAEYAALSTAFGALWSGDHPPDRAAAVRHAREFVKARFDRYTRLRAIRIMQDTGSISCREAEDIMELEEGGPQWLAHSTAVRAGLRTLDATRKAYLVPQRDAFYQTGALQLWILEGLLGSERMRTLTDEISRSRRGTEGILGRLIQETDAGLRPH